MRLILAALLLILPATAMAETKACLTVIDGQDIALTYDRKDEALRENQSTRERWLGRFGKVTCPGFVTLRAMTPGITDPERTPFCLFYNAKRETYSGFGLGERDAWLTCQKPETQSRFCRGVNATRETAGTVAGRIADAAKGRTDQNGQSFVHGSGALIASGAGSYVTSTLGSVASTVLATATAPATLTAAAVSVVAVGGAVFVCGD